MEVRANRASSYQLSSEPPEKEWDWLVSHKGHGATLQTARKTEERILRRTKAIGEETHNQDRNTLG